METKIKYYKNYISFIHCNKKREKSTKLHLTFIYYIMLCKIRYLARGKIAMFKIQNTDFNFCCWCISV